MSLPQGVFTTLVRAALGVLVLTIMFLLWNWWQNQSQNLTRIDESIRALSTTKNTLPDVLERENSEAIRRVRAHPGNAAAIRARIATINNELAKHEGRVPVADRPSLEIIRLGHRGELGREIRLDAQLKLLAEERSHLQQLLSVLSYQEQQDEVAKQKILRDSEYLRMEEVRKEYEQARADVPVSPSICRFATTPACRRFVAARGAYHAQIERHKAAYRAWHEASQALARASKPTAPGDFRPALGSIKQKVETKIQSAVDLQQEESRRNRFARLWDAVRTPLWWSVQIIAGLLATGLVGKMLLYFVLAPLAARRAPITIEKTRGPLSQSQSAPVRAPESKVSLSLDLHPGEELLIKADYLQDSPAAARGRTRLLLNWRFALASLASGMYGLTQITSDSTTKVIVSSTESPMDEVTAISIVQGHKFVLQPRYLVAVLQRTDQPIRISSSWRFNTVHAWLTLQFRYLIFHGPGTLVVKGCRGVRLARPSSGRRVSQAATIGFSAGLSYSVAKTETFLSYLFGIKPLFHDCFEGANGLYAYQELPTTEQTKSFVKRTVEGIPDAILKMVGV